MFGLFKRKKAKPVKAVTEMPLKEWCVYCGGSYGEYMMTVFARTREEARQKAFGTAYDARKYLTNDNRNYKVEITYVRSVVPA